MVTRQKSPMDIPFLFYGTQDDSLLIVNNEIKGWGTPNAQYLFQMWRDIPSHVIYYRNQLSVDFLKEFNTPPLQPLDMNEFRYDYLGSGDLPPGFWLKFNMGLQVSSLKPYVSLVSYDIYDENINNLAKTKLYEGPLELEPVEFLVLLTNLSVSSSDGIEIIDSNEKNTLVLDDDLERREYNKSFYKKYMEFLVSKIADNSDYVCEILRLSGLIIIRKLIESNPNISQVIINTIKENLSVFPMEIRYLVSKLLLLYGVDVMIVEPDSTTELFNWI